MVAVTEAVIPDFSVLIFSPTSNVFWFKRTIPNVVTFGFSTTNPTALLANPVIFSPIIKSELFPLGPSYAVKVKAGRSGSPASFDSMTASNSIASATFNEIFLSWTLVPNTLLEVNPSFKLFVPIPDADSTDRLITITFDSFTFFCLVTTFDLRTVANRFAFPDALLNATNVTVFLSAAIVIWLALSGSTDPSSYDMKYLSSSNGWKNKSAPALGDVNWLPATVILLNCFLNWIVVFVTSRLSRLICLTGVTKLLSPTSKDGERRTRSLTSSEPGIKPSETPPLQTPVTDVTPTTLIVSPSVEIPVILLKRGTVSPGTV